MNVPPFDAEFAGLTEYVSLYRHLRWQVVPAGMPGENQTYKRPLITWRPHQSEFVDDDTAAQWFAGRRHPQIGIVTGACSDGVFVVDLDTHKSPDAAQWWQQVLTDNDILAFETPTQTTGGGGTQILFRAPSGWIPPTNKTSIGVDIRGQGGFAMLPPSRHESGRDYAWKEGLEPWAVPVMEAPPWLCDAIDGLIRDHGGGAVSGPVERLPGPANATGGLVRNVLTDEVTDGRETYMARVVWATLVNAYRDSPIMSDALAQVLMHDAFEVYTRHVQSRIRDPKTPRHLLLEREGRGITLFRLKWQRAYAKWDTEIRQAAEAGPPPKALPPSKAIDNNSAELMSIDSGDDWDSGDGAADDDDGDNPANLEPTLYWDYDTSNLPPRQWVYGRELIAKFVSVLGSPGGVGKSSLAIVQVLSVALGRSLLSRKPETVFDAVHTAGPVWIYNAEDPTEEMLRRIVGIFKHYGLSRADFPHNVYLDTGRDKPLIITERDSTGDLIASPVVDNLVDALKRRQIRSLLVDPFAHTHTAEENRTEEMVRVMSLWSQVADRSGTAIYLVHHFRKGGGAGDAEAFRGSSAIQGAARVMSTLSAMSEAEAERLDIDPATRRSYVRLDNAKSNMAPPADVALWFRLVSVCIDNATEKYPADYVQVVETWDPPSPFDDITWGTIVAILDEIDAGLANGSRYTDYHQKDSNRWAGTVVIKHMTRNGGKCSESKAKKILGKWVQEGLLAKENYHDPEQRKQKQGLIVDRDRLSEMKAQNAHLMPSNEGDDDE
jgi:hypothetical protein